MDIADPKLEEYAEQHTTSPEPLLQRLAEETRATLECPQMLTGLIERFLELLVHGLRATRAGARSVLGLRHALDGGGPTAEGRIDTCELDPERVAVARRYVEEAGYADRVTIHEVKKRSRRSTGSKATSTSSSSTRTRRTTSATTTGCCPG